MKTTKLFIEEIMSKDNWQWIKYDGRKRVFRNIDKEEFKQAQERRIYRLYYRAPYEHKSLLRKCYESVTEWSRAENGNYQKIVMYGHTWLYLCSPIYGHSDYNKIRLMPIKGNEKECNFLMKVSRRIAGI